jgi:hypothetical protein
MWPSTPAPAVRDPYFAVTISQPRTAIFATRVSAGRGRSARRENGTDTPTTSRKTGKTTSATCSPFHAACLSWSGIAPLPRLSTSSIPTTARPRSTSIPRSRGRARAHSGVAGHADGAAASGRGTNGCAVMHPRWDRPAPPSGERPEDVAHQVHRLVSGTDGRAPPRRKADRGRPGGLPGHRAQRLDAPSCCRSVDACSTPRHIRTVPEWSSAVPAEPT